jgi:hypothetical protein
MRPSTKIETQSNPAGLRVVSPSLFGFIRAGAFDGLGPAAPGY